MEHELTEAPKQTMGLTFDQAMKELEDGVVARGLWAGSGKFIFRQVPAQIDREIISKMQSLPKRLKIFLLADETRVGIAYKDQVCMMDESGFFVNYNFSVSDIFASDWYIVA